MWKYILLLIHIGVVRSGSQDFPMPKYGSPLTEATSDIIFNYYMKESATLNIFYSSIDESASEGLKDVINEILYLLRGKIVIQLEEYSNIRYSKGKKFYNLFICDTYESFLKIFQRMDQQLFDYQGFYLIIISQYNYNQYEMMTRMFESLWSAHIVNANVLTMPSENEALAYTYYPYTNFYCGKAFPVQLNQYRFGKWLRQADYFPEKMTNLYGCTLRVATFSNPPFMIIKQHEDGRVEIDGIDGILLRVLAQKLNFNVELFLTDDHMWGDVYENGTSTGCV